MTLYFCGHWYLLVVYISRKRDAGFLTTGGSADNHDMPWKVLWMGIYLGLHILLSGGMLVYHTQLMLANLTTNEHLNVARYDYLWETSSLSSNSTNNNSPATPLPPRRRYKNPWFRGYWGNIMDRLDPSERSYMLPEQFEQQWASANNSKSSSNGSAALSNIV